MLKILQDSSFKILNLTAPLMSVAHRNLLSLFSSMRQWLTYLNLGLSAFADICITLALCYYLLQHRTPMSHQQYGFLHLYLM